MAADPLGVSRHKLAVVGLVGDRPALCVLISIFAEFVAPFDPTKQNRRAVYHPPQMIHFVDWTDDGMRLRPFVYEMDRQRDPVHALAVTYVPSGEKTYLTGLRARATPTSCGGCFPDRHLLVHRKHARRLLHLRR